MKEPTQKLGDFRTLTACRFCGGQRLDVFLDFGLVPLAGGFLKPAEIPNERFYPMKMQFCQDCTLVQVDTVVNADTLFKNYFFFSSAIQTLREHFGQFAAEISRRFSASHPPFVVEIGCNDGVLLRHLLALKIPCLGVDPASNVVKSIQEPGIRVVNDYFTKVIAERVRQERGPADVIVSSFSFAHIDDMHEVLRGVDALLAPTGALIVEIYYLGIIVEELQYDMFYHEHMSYYSLKALENFFGQYGLEIFDVERVPLRGGALRFYAQRKNSGKRPITPAVAKQRVYEKNVGLEKFETFVGFAKKVHQTKVELMGLLDKIKREGKSIIGYGASGRANTIMNYCGIDTRHLDYSVDDAPAKNGYLTPGTHVPIRPWPESTVGRAPDYALVFAWSFIEEVRRKRGDYLKKGGKFIVPLPQLGVISS